MKKWLQQLSVAAAILFLFFPGWSKDYCMAGERINRNLGINMTEEEMLQGADISPLSQDTFLRFQEIKLAGDGCSSNYRFLVFEDGRFFLQENKGKECQLRPHGSKFNRPFTFAPLLQLDTKQMDTIRNILKINNFLELQELYFPEEKVFDGSIKIMEINKAGKTKRVVSYANSCKELEAILETIWSQVYR